MAGDLSSPELEAMLDDDTVVEAAATPMSAIAAPRDAANAAVLDVEPDHELAEPPFRPWPIPFVVALVVGGAALLYAGLGVLTEVTSVVRIAFVLVGFGGLYLAYQAIGRRVAGPQFQAGLWAAATWLVVVALSATFVGVLPLAESHDPSKTFSEPILAPPDLFSRHPLGTDRQGLDMLGGVMYGFRVSAVVGVGTVLIGIVVGGFIGTLAGYHRGRPDKIVELFTNSALAFPPLILLLGVAAALDRNVFNITMALAVVSIPIYVRLARSSAMVLCQREYVVAARALGAKHGHIIRKDIAPGVLRPLLSYAFVMIAVVVVAEASLSFLGLGIPRPEPTLGNMIAAGQTDFETYPHLVFVPAVALFVTVLSLNHVGEEVQRRWNPKQAKI